MYASLHNWNIKKYFKLWLFLFLSKHLKLPISNHLQLPKQQNPRLLISNSNRFFFSFRVSFQTGTGNNFSKFQRPDVSKTRKRYSAITRNQWSFPKCPISTPEGVVREWNSALRKLLFGGKIKWNEYYRVGGCCLSFVADQEGGNCEWEGE